jgi:ribonuclease D
VPVHDESLAPREAVQDSDEPLTEAGAPPAVPPAVPLAVPRDGVPVVVGDLAGLASTVQTMAAGIGPIAVDAERASGHRYGQRAFLIQLRREGAGTALIDPEALPDLSSLATALADEEWVIHAASQDLPCLTDLGMVPRQLFDTELGGRLAGFERVGLAPMVENLLGVALAKEHSAVDWSTRPLPEPWLRYAALDVEVLTDLRDAVEAELARQGKLDWAREEFAALLAAPPPTPRPDPWRRTSGLHRIRDRRRLAVVRELWTTRDALARQRDVSPGRLLSDAAIVEATLASPRTAEALNAVPSFATRGARRYTRQWLDAVERAMALPEEDLPPQHAVTEGPPPARLWSEREPAAAARLTACRAALAEVAAKHTLPVENLLSPDTVRRLAWQPPQPCDAHAVEEALLAHHARSWQISLTLPVLVEGLRPASAQP